MPCVDGGPSAEQVQRMHRDRQAVLRLACDRCREIEARGGVVPDWAQEWWQFHKSEDERRYQADQKARKQSEIRKRAIEKLSREEREELGV